MRIALVGAGAFGEKHLDGLRNIDGVTVTSIAGRELDATKAVAEKYGVGHVTTDLAETLARDDVDAVILCTPTQMHAAQAIACMEAGKHVRSKFRWPTAGRMRRRCWPSRRKPG